MIHPIGAKASAMNASNELPQLWPSVLYISGPAKGKNAPIKDRVKVLAAAALAAYISKASIRYVCTGRNIERFLRAKTPEPMGTTMEPGQRAVEMLVQHPM